MSSLPEPGPAVALPPDAAVPGGALPGGARAALGVAARAIAAVMGIALLALPVWLAVDPIHRPAVVRLAAAMVIAVTAVRILGTVRARLEAQPPSALDRAARLMPTEASIPREYRDLAEELHYARTSFGYWTRVLEPRLAALAARLPGALPAVPAPRSAARRLLRLGPGLGALRAAVGRLEGRQ